jgi:hypothetical protein
MADVFISYKREERPFAERLSIVLEQLGFEVWWDFDLLSGDRYRKVIRAVIDECRVAVVLWSNRAVESDFVMDEAEYAKAQGKLCPVRIDDVALPFGFGSLHTDDLTGWDSELFHPQFQSLVRAIELKVGRKGRLGADPRTSESQAAAAEMEAFKAAQMAGNPSALRAFLNMHPRGAFAGFVRRQVEEMETEAKAMAEAAEALRPPRPRKPRPAHVDPAPEADPLAEPKPEPAPTQQQAAQAPKTEDRVVEPPRPIEPAPAPVPVPGPKLNPAAWALIAVVAGVAIIAVAIGLSHGHASNTVASAAPDSSAAVVSDAASSAAPAAPSVDELTALAKPLLGAWAPAGLNCSYAVTITAADGNLSETSSTLTATTAAIEGADTAGAVKVKQSNGDEVTYAVSGDTLTKTPANGQATEMTRCAATN